MLGNLGFFNFWHQLDEIILESLGISTRVRTCQWVFTKNPSKRAELHRLNALPDNIVINSSIWKNVLLENDRKRNRPTSGGTCRGACVVDTLSRDCGSGIKWCSLFNYSNESFSLFVIYSGILKTRPMFQTCLLEFWGVGVFLKNERSFQLVYASIPFSHLKKKKFWTFIDEY